MTNTPQTLGSKRARVFWKLWTCTPGAHLLAQSAVSTVPPNLQSPSEPAESISTFKTHGRQIDIENSLLPERQQKKRAGSPDASPRPASTYRFFLERPQAPRQAVSDPSPMALD